MRNTARLLRLACTGVLLLAAATPALAQSYLVNPGFEDGPTGSGAQGWMSFGNVYTESAAPPQFVPYEGNQLVSMFGNWWGVFNVSGIYQRFPTSEGEEWRFSAKSRHNTGDPMVGSQAGGGNWVVQKIVFKDAGDNELPGASESIILDGTFAIDVWHDNAPVVGIAPAGAVAVEAYILYLQPLYDGGAAHIDAVKLIKPVYFDVRPASCPNPLNLGANGVLPAAVLGTEDFDVHDIDVSSLSLQGIAPQRSRFSDVAAPFSGEACGCTAEGPDGFTDLTLKFDAHAVAQTLAPGPNGEVRVLTLTGTMMDGTPFEAEDCVIIRGGPKDLIASFPDGSGGQDGEAPDPQVDGPGTVTLSVRADGSRQRIDYAIPKQADVTLAVYDVRGRLVERLVGWTEAAGTHTLEWNTSGHPNGIYFYRLEADGTTVTRKMAVIHR